MTCTCILRLYLCIVETSMTYKDIVGKRFGRLTILYLIPTEDGRFPKGKGRGVLAVCDCGNFVLKPRSCVVAKRGSKSCGCLQRDSLDYFVKSIKKPNGESSFNEVFGAYKYTAKKRGLPFEIDKATFKEIIMGDCTYCGCPPSNTRNRSKTHGSLLYNGIDRVDNNLGYVNGNVTPCCHRCNTMKSEMSVLEFLAHLRNIYSLWKRVS